jgi:hypothetical protein
VSSPSSTRSGAFPTLSPTLSAAFPTLSLTWSAAFLTLSLTLSAAFPTLSLTWFAAFPTLSAAFPTLSLTWFAAFPTLSLTLFAASRRSFATAWAASIASVFRSMASGAARRHKAARRATDSVVTRCNSGFMTGSQIKQVDTCGPTWRSLSLAGCRDIPLLTWPLSRVGPTNYYGPQMVASVVGSKKRLLLITD